MLPRYTRDMLTVLSIALSLTLLALTVGVFAVPYILFGPAHVMRMARQEEYRIFGGTMLSAALAVAFAPALAAGLISGHEAAQVFADNLNGLRWSI